MWRRHSCPRSAFGLFETKNVTLKECAMFRPRLGHLLAYRLCMAGTARDLLEKAVE